MPPAHFISGGLPAVLHKNPHFWQLHILEGNLVLSEANIGPQFLNSSLFHRADQLVGLLPGFDHLDRLPSHNGSYIEELKDVIRRLHGADATHVESVPVREEFQDRTVWDGIVEVFDLKGHQSAFRIYAWAHDTDDPKNPRRHVTVLHAHPIKTAQDAVKAAIIQEYRNLGTSEES